MVFVESLGLAVLDGKRAVIRSEVFERGNEAVEEVVDGLEIRSCYGGESLRWHQQ